MSLRRLLSLATLLVFSLVAGPGFARQDTSGQNWPNFRGPLGNGAVPDANPPVEFGLDKNLKWQTAIPGRGHSSPIVWNDRVYLMTAVDTGKKADGTAAPAAEAGEAQPPRGEAGRGGPPGGPPGGGRGGRGGRGGGPGGGGTANVFDFCVVCLERETGKIAWTKVVHSGVPHESIHNTNTFASGSPVTDGRHLWCHFGSEGVHCLDLEGNPVWSRDFGKMTTRNEFGEGASVAVHGNTVVIHWDHEGDSFVAAVDALTGKDIWKAERDEPTSWSTPLIVEHGGMVQVICNGTKLLRSYDLKTGEVIWEAAGQAANPVPTPMILDGVAYCMTGYRGFSVQAISLDARGDVTGSTHVLWKKNDFAPYVPTGTLLKGTLYYTKGNDGILTATDAKTGEKVFGPSRLNQLKMIYSSLVSGGDHIYICGRDGQVVVLKHGSEYAEAHTTHLNESIDATPAIAGNQLFIRGGSHLFCFENQ